MKARIPSIKIGLGIVIGAVVVTAILLALPEQKNAQLRVPTKWRE